MVLRPSYLRRTSPSRHPAPLLPANNRRQNTADDANAFRTTTPIKHLVIIFQENESFDHYFGTYPKATNPQGEPRFEAKADTPSVNGLIQGLIDNNHNHDAKNSVYQPIAAGSQPELHLRPETRVQAGATGIR